jgi:hypothetical protein
MWRVQDQGIHTTVPEACAPRSGLWCPWPPWRWYQWRYGELQDCPRLASSIKSFSREYGCHLPNSITCYFTNYLFRCVCFFFIQRQCSIHTIYPSNVGAISLQENEYVGFTATRVLTDVQRMSLCNSARHCTSACYGFERGQRLSNPSNRAFEGCIYDLVNQRGKFSVCECQGYSMSPGQRETQREIPRSWEGYLW